jgi:hypothetical protein
LNSLLDSIPRLQAEKENEFKNIKSLLKGAEGNQEQKYYITKKIIQNYISYNSDSAMYYIDINLILCRNLNNVKMVDETKLFLTEILSTTGQYTEALETISEINRKTLPSDLLSEYYYRFGVVYSDLERNGKYKKKKEEYIRLYNCYADSLLNIGDTASDHYLEFMGRRLRDSLKMEAALDLNLKRLSKYTLGSRNYSIAAFDRSINYWIMGNIELRKKFLILSAISDIKSSSTDNFTLPLLATILFKEKDVNLSHKYIQVAFNDAVLFNSSIRFTEIANILQIIDKDYQVKTESQKSKLYNLLIVISVLSIVILFTLLFIYWQKRKLTAARKDLQLVNKQLKELNEHLNLTNERLNSTNDKLEALNNELAESNHVKEQYIGNFISICSNYIDKLDQYRKFVNAKITTHKLNELHEYTKSRTLIDNELKEFYANFDNTFLNIYPNFVEEFNALLAEDERIMLKKGELLSVELRIFALIRLGISESTNIAVLLRYSVQTIYNYRLKFKNKAIVPREEFENIVRKIGSFNKTKPV